MDVPLRTLPLTETDTRLSIELIVFQEMKMNGCRCLVQTVEIRLK
jgi:hypothetical protein